MPRPSRKQQILETLAQELQRQQGKKITTASLASAAGVSEAALYRHFASKAKMFEALIEFAEESVFVRTNQILAEERARRRHAQLQEAGVDANISSLLTEIQARDARDMGRAVAPLKPADDGVILDTTDLDIEQVIERIQQLLVEYGLVAAR